MRLIVGLLLAGFLLVCPMWAAAQPAPPTGFVWQQTFNDDMNSVDPAKWNGLYGLTDYCGVSGAGCSQNYQGLLADGWLYLQSKVNYSNFSDLTRRSAENTSTKLNQRFGYFEWRAQLPHDSNDKGDGPWAALYAFPKGKTYFITGCGNGVNDSGAEEFDVSEVIGARSNMRQVRFTAHDRCFNEFAQIMPATPGPDLSAAYHTYGLYWKNDGSTHGTVCGFFDGVQQGSCYTLEPSSTLWDNGIFLLNQMIPCPPNNSPFGGGAPCESGTSSKNPLFVDYTRAWNLVPTGATPSPSSTPAATPTVPSRTPTPYLTGCAPAWTAPTNASNPKPVSGTIALSFTPNCSFDHAVLFVRCPDSSIFNFACGGPYPPNNPISGPPYYLQINEGHNTSFSFNTNNIANAPYDFGLGLFASNETYLGGVGTAAPEGTDGDEVLIVSNGSTPTPAATPNSRWYCDPPGGLYQCGHYPI